MKYWKLSALACLAAMFSETLTRASIIIAPDVVVTSFTRTYNPYDFGAGNEPRYEWDDKNFSGSSMSVTVNPGDVFQMHIAAPAGKTFQYIPDTNPNTYTSLEVFLYIDSPDAQAGTWTAPVLTFDGATGSAGTPSYSTFFNNGTRVFDFDNDGATTPISFTGIDVSLTVPSDANSNLRVDQNIFLVKAQGDENLPVGPMLAVVPEPGSLSLFSLCIVGILGSRRRHRRFNWG